MFTEYNEFLNEVGREKSPQTWRSYKNAIDKFIEYFNIESLDNIKNLSTKKIKEYRSFLQGQDSLTITSVNAYMRPVNAFFTWLTKNENDNGEVYLSVNPMDKIQPLKEPDRIYPRLTQEEMESMVEACDNNRDKLILGLMMSTGIRRGEVVSIRVKDITNTHIKVRVKGGGEVLVVIHDSIRPLLEKHLENHEGEYLFMSPRKDGKALSAETVRLVVMNAAQKANIDEKIVKHITPHTFRRSLGTEVINNGEGMDKAQKILHHKNQSTTQIYAKVAQATVDKILLNRKIEIR